jgi:hypothetical protein
MIRLVIRIGIFENAGVTIPETKGTLLLFLVMTITLLMHRSLPQSSVDTIRGS